jgi:hypothetical protein
MPSKEIMEFAKEEGFKNGTLQRAGKELGIKCSPDFDEDGEKFWVWKLPGKKSEPLIPGLEEKFAQNRKMLKRLTDKLRNVPYPASKKV